jgi:glutathione S-transferase
VADYDLYYWPVPFRGQFIRAILAHAGKTWTEHGPDEIEALMGRSPADQPVPFVGPPVLIAPDGFALSQMPAIALHLGDELGLTPADPRGRAMTAKIVADANDVIDELTLDGGRQMWTAPRWKAFAPRLARWMRIWETTAERNGVTADGGWMLGTPAPGVADVVTSVLWSTMGDRFPPLRTMLDEAAPRTAALARRLQATPPLAALKARSFELYGQAYCGGEIEKSLRRVIDVPI